MNLSLLQARAKKNHSNYTPGDPYWANVVSLLHFDGTDASTTFADQTGKVWTAAGNAQIDTAQSEFGGASLLVDGAGDYIRTPNHVGFDFAAGDFTVEFFARPAAAIGSTQIALCKATTDGSRSWVAGFAAGNVLYFGYSANSTNLVDIVSPAAAISSGAFSHVAYVRSGAEMIFYVNGLEIHRASLSATLATVVAETQIGGRPSDNQFFNGHIDELRITKGVARYTANFAPPTAQFPDHA